MADATATFEFSSTEPGVTFECMLTKDGINGVPEAACTSPKEYTELAPGTYTFSVVGIDEAGNRSEPVVSESWTVAAPPDLTPPVVTIDPVVVTGTTATVSFGANEIATYQCQLAKGKKVSQAWAPCTSPKTYTGLTPATYTVSVRGTDAAGNPSLVAASTFVVTKVKGNAK